MQMSDSFRLGIMLDENTTEMLQALAEFEGTSPQRLMTQAIETMFHALKDVVSFMEEEHGGG